MSAKNLLICQSNARSDLLFSQRRMSSSLYKAVCQPGVTPFPLISYLMRSNLVAGKVMALPSTLFLIFFSANPILRRTVWPEPKEGRTALTQDRQQRSASEVIKVLDFSDDIDHQPDSNGEYTSATLEGLALTSVVIVYKHLVLYVFRE